MDLSAITQAYKDKVPPIAKILVDMVIGGVVFVILFYVTEVIHDHYAAAVNDRWEYHQIVVLWIVENLFFYGDCAGVGIYVICRLITHIFAIISTEAQEWKKK